MCVKIGGKAVWVGFGGSVSGFQRAGDASGPPMGRPRPGSVKRCGFAARLRRMNGGRRARGGAAISGYRARHAWSRARGSDEGAGLTRRGGSPCRQEWGRAGGGSSRPFATFCALGAEAQARSLNTHSATVRSLCALGAETDGRACSGNKVGDKGKAAARAAAGDRDRALDFDGGFV